MTFSADAWTRNGPLIAAAGALPFNRELAEGRLPLPTFRRHMIQDALYLVAFAQALALAAARADRPEHVALFARAAVEAIEVERGLHTGFFARFGIPAEEVAGTAPSAVTHHYACFLLATGTREPLAVQLAALLPCFWLYREVGRAIHARAGADNPYRAWIDTYAGEDFSRAVDAMIAATDAVAHEAGEGARAPMHAHFTQACRLEWMFWDAAHRGADWPI